MQGQKLREIAQKKLKEYRSREDVQARRKTRGLSTETKIKDKNRWDKPEAQEKKKSREQTTEHKLKKMLKKDKKIIKND